MCELAGVGGGEGMVDVLQAHISGECGFYCVGKKTQSAPKSNQKSEKTIEDTGRVGETWKERERE